MWLQVGSFSKGMFLVHSEVQDNNTSRRSFRVNAVSVIQISNLLLKISLHSFGLLSKHSLLSTFPFYLGKERTSTSDFLSL